ncbi:DUF5984 family protein [Nocardia vulneris]|uniref:DUF5984 family protein n=1 Tax=Nocardia vulneris TaxID=1141657 RepID=UPI0030D4FFF9
MIRFRFGLAPVDRVAPWGEQRRTLHWFALTEGWYGIDLGGQSLLRYSARTTELLRTQSGGVETPYDCYVAYYVARLWEDLLALLPSVLEPVPGDLADFIGADAADWRWSESDAAEAAATWYGEHTLDTGYLWFGPHLRWWRTIDGAADTVTLAWHHPPDPEHEIEFTAPSSGRISVPTDEFRSAVRELDRALLSAMATRLREFESSGPPPGIDLDLDHLAYEQDDRARWLARAMNQRPDTDWSAVRSGADALRRSSSALP